MDEFPIYFILLLVVSAVLLLPAFAFVRSGQARSTAEALREEIRSLRTELGRATARIIGLEKALGNALEKLESRPGGVQEPEVAATPQQVPAPVIPPAPPIPTIPRTRELGSAVPRVPDAGVRIPPSAHASQVPNIFSTASGGSASRATTGKKRNWADMEETLGANWLNKIGTAA